MKTSLTKKIAVICVLFLGMQTTLAKKIVATKNNNDSVEVASKKVENRLMPPPGDPSQFGNNQWNVYGYSSGTIANLSAAVYAGYYTVNSVSFNSETGSNGWNAALSPTSSPGWLGDVIGNDNFVLVHKRKGFPCGVYTLTMQNWDDACEVYVDGVLAWSCSIYRWGSSCGLTVGTFTLGATSEVEVRLQEDWGGAIVALDFSSSTSASTAPTGITGNTSICGAVPTTLTAVGGTEGSGSEYQWGTGLVAGSNIISGATTSLITVTPLVTTTYWVRRIDAAPCVGETSSASTTINVTTPPGDPSGFGSNAWNAYGYTGTNIDLSDAIYKGFYTTNSLGFESDLGSNGWNGLLSPSSSPTWSGCTLTEDDFVLIHKRKGFPCGNYSLSMDYWDDDTEVYINGVRVWSCANWFYGAVSCNGNIGNFDLDSNSEIEVRLHEYEGGSIIRFAVTLISTTSTAPTTVSGVSAICNGSSTTLTASGGSTGTNGSFQWGTGSIIGSNIILGETSSTLTVSPSATTVYWVRRIDSSPCPSTTAGVAITVNVNVVTVTSTSPSARCGTGTVTIGASPSAGTINWYATATGGTSIASGTTFTTPILTSSTTYYAEAFSSGCSSLTRTAVTATIDLLNVGTLGSSQVLCTGTNPSDLTLTGHTGAIVRWESADDSAFTSNLQTISTTSSTLTYAEMGVIDSIKYYRVVLTNASCNQVSNSVSISYPTTTWNGSTWSNGYPDSYKKVIFNGNFNTTDNLLPFCECNAMYCCSVKIDTGVTVIIDADITLDVQNEVIIDNSSNPGQLIFENNTALVQHNDLSINSGIITYKRETVPVRKFDYTYWSSPVSSQNLFDLSPLTLFDKYYMYNPTIGNWQYTEPNTTTMEIARGYIVRSPQTFDNSNPSIYEAQFIGVPNNGVINYNIVNGLTNWNLIGNPYPSALKIDDFLNDNNNDDIIQGTVYLWTHNTLPSDQIPGDWMYNYTSDDYAVYNTTGSIATRGSISSGITNNAPSGFIAAGQAFFVRANNSGAVQFRNSMREIGQNSEFFRVTQSDENEYNKSRIWLNLINSEGAFKQILVGYINGATDHWDSKYDAEILNGNSFVNFYSIDDDEKKMSIQAKGLPFSDTFQIPLGYKSSVSGNFSIEIDKLDGLFSNHEVFLKDKLLNILHPLKQGKYDFTTTDGTFDDRFELRFTDQALSTEGYATISNSIQIASVEDDIRIASSITPIKEISVYDGLGKLLYSKNNVNNKSCRLENILQVNQFYLIVTTLEDGFKSVDKIIR